MGDRQHLGGVRGRLSVFVTWASLPPVLGAEEVRGWTRTLEGPVALTGATGFIGSHLLETLANAGVPCRVLARDRGRLTPCSGEVEVVVGDLESRAALERLVSGCPVVIHLAGLVRSGRRGSFFDVNHGGTIRLLEAAGRSARGCHFVQVSSQAAVGPCPLVTGKSPGGLPEPVSAYGRSKLAAEESVRNWTAGSWSIVRPPAVYGPRDTDVFQFFRLAVRGWLPLPAGERWVTMGHVSDVVRGILAAASLAPSGQILHLGPPQPLLMTDMVRRLAAAGGLRARAVGVPGVVLRVMGRVGDCLHLLGVHGVALTSDKVRELRARHWTLETGSSLRLLGLTGAVDFDEGAAATWAWYRQQGWLPRGTISPV